MTVSQFDSPDPEPGYQVYSRRTLSWYDTIVHRFSNRWLWNCPTENLKQWFDRHVSSNHLDVGVGTGYFLKQSTKLVPGCRLGLLDANPNCLEAAASRVAELKPEVFQANLAESFAERFDPYESLSLMYVLHCLPGAIAFRRRVLQHCVASVIPGGRLFGATILGQPQPMGWWGRLVMAKYNRKGIFGNLNDTLDRMKDVLSESLADVQTEQIGSVVLFAGVRP